MSTASNNGAVATPTAPTLETFGLLPVEISSTMPYPTRYVEVLGSQIAYVEAGEGDPILFLHGNPTSKYLWRNIMPWLESQGRVIAPDLIGMGESDKPDIGYTFADHARYVEGFIEARGLRDITLVIHDWGSGLGFDYAARNPDNVKRIAFMEAIVMPAAPGTFAQMPPQMAELFRTMRTPGVGEELVINQNMFVEQILPGSVVRALSDAEMDAYRRPYLEASARKPVWVWPNQVPIDGVPADVVAIVENYNQWLRQSDLPKLHIYVSPGALNPPEAVGFLQQKLTNYETVYVGQGLHFLQEDHPEAIGRAISDWVRRN